MTTLPGTLKWNSANWPNGLAILRLTLVQPQAFKQHLDRGDIPYSSALDTTPCACSKLQAKCPTGQCIVCTVLQKLNTIAARLFFFPALPDKCETWSVNNWNEPVIEIKFPQKKETNNQPNKNNKTSNTHTQAKARARQNSQGNLQTK